MEEFLRNYVCPYILAVAGLVVFGVVMLYVPFDPFRKVRERIKEYLMRYNMFWRCCVWARSHRRYVLTGTFIVMALVVISFAFTSWISGDMKLLMQTPGTVFVVGLAIITCWGFTATINRIYEIGMKITRYDELLIRVTDLLKVEIEKANSDRTQRRIIHMLCNTPLIGNVTLNSNGHGCYHVYKNALEAVLKHDNIELRLLHIPAIDLEAFYDRFTSTYPETKVNAALQESVSFINKIREQGKTSSHRVYHFLHSISHRMVITKDEAIFFTPLYLPEESQGNTVETSGGEGQQKNKKRRRRKKQKVEMVGFATEDALLISDLRDNFRYHFQKSEEDGGKEDLETTRSLGITVSSLSPTKGRFREADAVIWVNGLTRDLHDKYSRTRVRLRYDISTKFGIDSYEFDYRGRGKRLGPMSMEQFSLSTAAEDFEEVLNHVIHAKKKDNIVVIAQGIGAYVVLLSETLKNKSLKQNFHLIFCQPILYPKKTMDYRGHLSAFDSYRKSEGHKYVELGGIRLHEAFFDDIENVKPAEQLTWNGMTADIIYTRGDKVTQAEWIEEFIEAVNASMDNGIAVSGHVLDSEQRKIGHTHDVDHFRDKIKELIKLRVYS